MKVIIAPQAFKESLSGPEAAMAIKEGVLAVFPGAEVLLIPIADGGDGTLQTLIDASGGHYIKSQVPGPLGCPVLAPWGVMGDGKTAVIEMAMASGLALIPQGGLNPRSATTIGTGMLIKEALDKGYRNIIVGLGGSATNDGGAGAAKALGAVFLNASGFELPLGGASLSSLSSIDISGIHPALKASNIIIATDVNNLLCGPNGASVIYGPQKGASPPIVAELDAALENYQRIIKETLGIDLEKYPGAGSAGGLGAGLIAFANAKVRSGIELVSGILRLEELLNGASLVITAEGRIDRSTVCNKAPIGVARTAKRFDIPVIAMTAVLGEGYELVHEHGIDAVVSISDGPMDTQESINRTYSLLSKATERSLRLVQINLRPIPLK
jgi:glycerate kinase